MAPVWVDYVNFYSFFNFISWSGDRVATVKFLLENGASVNPTYPGGNT